MTETIRVDIPGAAHDVVVGEGVIDDVGDLLAERDALAGATRAAIVTSAPVGGRYGARVRASLEDHVEVHEIVIDDGEAAKNLDTVTSVYREFAQIPLNRGDVVVALGGGVVGDLAGFAAATWNRGLPVVQVPTTLLAQVDSSIGGKTGVNIAEGKNLVGAFHQPVLVVSDISTLSSLPRRELLAGLGEVLKYGFIADPDVLRLLEDGPDRAIGGDPETLADLVHRSVAVKGEIVAADERESGRRMLLNYGHTVGHAIEAVTGYTQFRHGEAVALGMIVAAHVGEAMQVSEPGLTERTTGVLGRLGLPTGGVPLDGDAVWRAMARDKKTAEARIRMVLCLRPGEVRIVANPPRDAVDEGLARIA